MQTPEIRIIEKEAQILILQAVLDEICSQCLTTPGRHYINNIINNLNAEIAQTKTINEL